MKSDTSPEFQAKYEAMIMALPLRRRLEMGASMFESCRQIQRMQLKAENVPEALWPGELFKRTYADLYEPDLLADLMQKLNAYAAKARANPRTHQAHP